LAGLTGFREEPELTGCDHHRTQLGDRPGCRRIQVEPPLEAGKGYIYLKSLWVAGVADCDTVEPA
jgi:hypothetical protein